MMNCDEVQDSRRGPCGWFGIGMWLCWLCQDQATCVLMLIFPSLDAYLYTYRCSLAKEALRSALTNPESYCVEETREAGALYTVLEIGIIPADDLYLTLPRLTLVTLCVLHTYIYVRMIPRSLPTCPTIETVSRFEYTSPTQ